MRLTAREQQALGVIDHVVPSPTVAPTTTPRETARRLREAIEAQLEALVDRDLGRPRAQSLRALPCLRCLHDGRRAGPRAA